MFRGLDVGDFRDVFMLYPLARCYKSSVCSPLHMHHDHDLVHILETRSASCAPPESETATSLNAYEQDTPAKHRAGQTSCRDHGHRRNVHTARRVAESVAELVAG